MKKFGIGCLAIVGGLVVLFIIIAIVGVVASSHSNLTNQPAATAKPDNSGTVAPVAAPAPTRKPAKARVLLDLTGSAPKSTQKFTTGSDWDMKWTYDCSQASGGEGNFIVSIYPYHPELIGLNELGKGGGTTEHYHVGGTFYLQIQSSCPWHVTVVG